MQAINPLHGSNGDAKGDQQQQLNELAKVTAQESMSIIGDFMGDENIGKHCIFTLTCR